MSNKVLKNTAVILGCSIVAKLLSFIWEAILASYLGASDQADALSMTLAIFNILYPILDMGIWKVFLPIYKTKMLQDPDNKHKFANIALTYFACLSVAFTIFLIVFAKPITTVIAPGFSLEKKMITMQYLQWSAPRYLLMASTSVVGAILQCHGKFFGSQLREIGTHISRILFIVICFRYMGINAAILALIIGSFFRLIVQLPFIDWKWRFKPDFHFRNQDMRQMIKGLPSVAITAAVNHVNGLVDKVIASGAVSGAVACLNYGSRLMNVFSGMISSAIATSTYPTIVQYIAEKRTEKLRSLLSNIINVLSFFIIPISIFCIFFSRDIVKIAFERGAFEQSATALTASVFTGYCIGMLFIGLSTIITNVFYSHGDTKVTLMISVFDIILNIALNLWFCRMWDVVGLAIATSVSAAICFVIRLVLMKKYITLDYRKICLEQLKIILISGISVVGGFLLLKGIDYVYLRIIGSMAFSVVVYLALAKILRVSAMSSALDIIRKKSRPSSK